MRRHRAFVNAHGRGCLQPLHVAAAWARRVAALLLAGADARALAVGPFDVLPTPSPLLPGPFGSFEPFEGADVCALLGEPVHWAALHGDAALLDVLVGMGADLDARAMPVGPSFADMTNAELNELVELSEDDFSETLTPLEAAFELAELGGGCGLSQCVRTLLARGATPEFWNAERGGFVGDPNCFHKLIVWGDDAAVKHVLRHKRFGLYATAPETQFGTAETALHVAARRGHAEIVQRLLDRGAWAARATAAAARRSRPRARRATPATPAAAGSSTRSRSAPAITTRSLRSSPPVILCRTCTETRAAHTALSRRDVRCRPARARAAELDLRFPGFIES